MRIEYNIEILRLLSSLKLNALNNNAMNQVKV